MPCRARPGRFSPIQLIHGFLDPIHLGKGDRNIGYSSRRHVEDDGDKESDDEDSDSDLDGSCDGCRDGDKGSGGGDNNGDGVSMEGAACELSRGGQW